MSSLVSRWLEGLLYFAVGIFWSVVVIPSFAWYVIRKGPKGLLTKNQHDALPKVAENPKFEHDFVRVKSGLRFHCVHSGLKTNPLMLCLHGFPECWYSYHYILDHFSENYHVVSFDMRGYGESDKPKGAAKYHMDYLATDVKELIEALGYEKATIVSHDWGGAVGWIVPEFYPEVVDKLIVMNAPHHLAFMEFAKRHPSQLLKIWYMFMYQLPFLAEFLISAYDYKNIGSMLCGKSFGIKNRNKQLSNEELANPIYTGMNLKPKSEKIRVPVLVIWGKGDTAMDHRSVSYFGKYVDDLTVVFIEGASHWVALDEPEQVHEAMDKFLEKTL